MTTIMNRRMASTLALVLVLAACSGADSAHKAESGDVKVSVVAAPMPEPVQSLPVEYNEIPAPDKNREAYDVLVERVQVRGTARDFAKLRKAYIRTDLYNPYDRHQRQLARDMVEALDANDLRQCIELANALLQRNYTHLGAHSVAANCHGRLGDSEQQQMHARIYSGLINAIDGSGDGRKAGSAYVVISVDEIYDFLQAKDLEVAKRALLDDPELQGERHIQVMPVRDPRSGDSFNLYFDISAEQKYFARKLRSSAR
jgi:hypothetical protein